MVAEHGASILALSPNGDWFNGGVIIIFDNDCAITVSIARGFSEVVEIESKL